MARALIGKAGLRRDTPLAGHEGLAEPLRQFAERYSPVDVCRELLNKVADGDQAVVRELMKKRPGGGRRATAAGSDRG